MDLLQKEPGGPFKGWDPAMLSNRCSLVPLPYSQNQVGGCLDFWFQFGIWMWQCDRKTIGEFMKDYLEVRYLCCFELRGPTDCRKFSS